MKRGMEPFLVLNRTISSKSVGPDAVRELSWVTYLSLRATKEIARAIGWSTAALVATERHLWLNLAEIKYKDRAFLLDGPVTPPGLYSDSVNTVIEMFQEAKRPKKYLPCCSQPPGAV